MRSLGIGVGINHRTRLGAGLPFAINVTGAQLRDALANPSAWGETLGPELVSNGTFDSGTTGWAAGGSPTVTVGANGATVQNGGAVSGYLSQPLTTIAGRAYRVAGAIVYGGAGFARIEHGNAISGPGGSLINATASGTYSYTFTATASTTYVIVGNRSDNNASHTYDNISVREVVTGWLLPGLGGARLSGDCRTSVAMQTAVDGTVGYAAHNLLTYSTDPSNSSVLITGGTKGATVTPAGDPFPSIEVTLTNGYIYQAATIVDVATYTASAVIKAGTMNKARVYFTSGGFSTAVYAVVDLAAGTIGSVVPMNNGVPGTATIESLGGGRFRVAVSGRLPGITAGYLVVGVDTSGGTFEFGGAQLNLGPTALPYVPTTTAARFGPAIDWLSGIGQYGIRSESARTNLAINSGDVLSGTGGVVVANQITAPDGSLADFFKEDTSNGEHYAGDRTPSVTAGTTYTWSFYAKLGLTGEARRVSVRTGAQGPASVIFDLETGSSTVVAPVVSSGISSAGNGWFRCWIVYTATGTGVAVFRQQLSKGINTIYTGDGTSGLFFWGAQLEVGTEASSPILTYGAAATRAADTLVVLDSGWINQAEGTVVLDCLPRAIGQIGIASLNNGTGSNRIDLRTLGLHFVDAEGVNQATLTTSSPTAGVLSKAALGYAVNNFAVSRNGGAAVTDVSGTVPAMTQMQLGGLESNVSFNLNGHLTRIRYSRRRASNGQLQALTV